MLNFLFIYEIFFAYANEAIGSAQTSRMMAKTSIDDDRKNEEFLNHPFPWIFIQILVIENNFRHYFEHFHTLFTVSAYLL